MNVLLKNTSRICLKSAIQAPRRCLSLSSIVRSAEGRMGYPNERYEPTTIAALDKDEKRLPLISGLYEDGFMIAGRDRIVGAIFSFPRQVICWNVSRFSRMSTSIASPTSTHVRMAIAKFSELSASRRAFRIHQHQLKIPSKLGQGESVDMMSFDVRFVLSLVAVDGWHHDRTRQLFLYGGDVLVTNISRTTVSDSCRSYECIDTRPSAALPKKEKSRSPLSPSLQVFSIDEITPESLAVLEIVQPRPGTYKPFVSPTHVD